MQDMGQEAAAGEIAGRLAAVGARIAAAEAAAGRKAGSVGLVAVSKGHGAPLARAALDAGHRLFGENRVQEAAAKWPPLRTAFADCRLHLIGPLQTNKVKEAVALFDAIETVDRPRLAAALAREFDRSGRRVALFVEVNTGEEPQKAGVLPDAADGFIAACRGEYGLAVEGLMCIPPLGEEPAMHFALLAQIAARNGVPALSMGMSADFETAIRFGATHVRVGTAIFGDRPAG
jgi:pyridoxal phosphate enzyme (YggS family)